MDEDFSFITLRCRHCENTECQLYPIGAYIREDEGCTRRVKEEDKEQWQYYTEEVQPFLHLQNNPDFRPIDMFLRHIYRQPIGHKLDKKGKAVLK